MNYKNKPIFAMIHLHGGVDRAIKEIDILQSEGVEGIIVENYHGTTRDIIDTLKEIRGLDMLVGVNILPNEFHESIHMASVYGADFVQLDFVSGSYKRNATINEIELEAMRNRYPNIEILGGVHPKYYEPVVGSILENDLGDGVKRCNAIVVTGSGTGKETPLDKIKEFRSIIGDFPSIVGAGMDTTNMVEQLTIADGAIVGSSLKPYKRTQELINRDLVQELMELKRTI